MNRRPNKVESGGGRGESHFGALPPFANPQSPIPNPLRRSRHGFTLVELLVTVTIIGILAGMMFGALQLARETAREAATKATIAKLHTIIMRRYESYMTRRVPVALTMYHDGTRLLTPQEAAQDRLYAMRDLMRMEMPDRYEDLYGSTSAPISNINELPIVLPNSHQRVPPPALAHLYRAYWAAHPPGASAPGKECAQAEILYLIVSMGSPEAMEQFNQSEIGDSDGNGWLEFLDGWGRPIFWLRWAPAFSSPLSDIQFNDPANHHDPFDPRRVDSAAFQLFPLIFSGGTDKEPGLNIESHFSFNAVNGDVFGSSAFLEIGTPSGDHGRGLITNHHIEAR